jgi:hypothetical protein
MIKFPNCNVFNGFVQKLDFLHQNRKTYRYSKSFRFLKNYKIRLVCGNDITLLKANTKNVISVLSPDYYNENCHFQADFSTNAYVFVFLIVPMYIGIYLFPSINP